MSDNTQLAEREEATAPATQSQGSTTLIQMIERASTDPKVDIEKMERLYEMYQRETARQAEAAFNAALTEAQSEMGRVSADAENPQTKSWYASYAALDRALRPIYTKHGFALSFDTGESPKDDHIRVVCYVSHRDGHSRTYHRDVPVTTTGIQGKVNMTATHASASAESYGRRYLLRGIFNVAVGEDDDDGNGATDDPGMAFITPDQVADLEALIEEVGADRGRFLDYLSKAFKADGLDGIRQKALPDVVRALEARRGRQG